MRRLFGLPTPTLAVVLAVALGLAIAALVAFGIANRVFLRLGVRNANRRRSRTALIVVGLMLATTIISSALSTGDTIATTIRSQVLDTFGRTDEIVRPKGAAGTAGDPGYIDESVAATVRAALAGSGLVDGVTPVIVERIALQDMTSRRSEPVASLFAPDPAQLDGFDAITAGGHAVSLTDLAPLEVYADTDAAHQLGAAKGDTLTVWLAGTPVPMTVADIVSFAGAGDDTPTVLLSLDAAQTLLGRQGQIRAVFISNTGGPVSGARHSEAVETLLEPKLSPLGLEAVKVKADGLDIADEVGTVFMSVFGTFGMFSISAGILLIFLIFVMLAAERRSEMGIARAVGTKRSHLVQMFVFEGVVYDVIAAAIGAALGLAVAFGMVSLMARAFTTGDSDLSIVYSIQPRSLIIGYALGVLLTLAVVSFSAWRVSVLNVVAAIRDQPDPLVRKRRSRWLGAIAVLASGVVLLLAGLSSKQSTPAELGASLVFVGTALVAVRLGAPSRLTKNLAALAVVVLWMLPFSAINAIFGELKVNFSVWVVGGLAVVLGASYLIVANADVVLGAVQLVLGRVKALAPVLKTSIAYPLRNRFRTGVTLAMFTLVVFTLVVGAATTASFTKAFDDSEAFGGGFDVIAHVSPTVPPEQVQRSLSSGTAIGPGQLDVIAAQSTITLDVTQSGSGRDYEKYQLLGLDDTFLTTTTYGFAAMATGYTESGAIWQALRADPALAVVDANVAPRRTNFSFGDVADLTLSGFYLEDRTFAPVPLDVRDPQTGSVRHFTVIGVLKDTAVPMFGISVSQRALDVYGSRARPTTYWMGTAKGVDARATATALESAFLDVGMEAKSVDEMVSDQVAANRLINNLVLGFMGLGLVVGVAALGVVSARSVVERRQHIGVLRSIGFQQRMVEASFLIEAGFIAVTSILVGTSLGLVAGYNVIADQRRQPTWDRLTMVVPWTTLLLVFGAVLVAAFAATLAPARRAARVPPAAALRYQ